MSHSSWALGASSGCREGCVQQDATSSLLGCSSLAEKQTAPLRCQYEMKVLSGCVGY